MKYYDAVVYDFCGNKIKTIYMATAHKFGDYFMLNCGYTGNESHYIYLGEL